MLAAEAFEVANAVNFVRCTSQDIAAWRLGQIFVDSYKPTRLHIDTTIACPIEADSRHYLRNGLADVGRVTGEVIRYGQPEPMRL